MLFILLLLLCSCVIHLVKVLVKGVCCLVLQEPPLSHLNISYNNWIECSHEIIQFVEISTLIITSTESLNAVSANKAVQ